MFLLDGQVLLWVLSDNAKLGARAREMIGRGGVHVSAATVWELTIKAALGRLTVPDKLSARLVDLGFLMLDVTADHADGLREFPELTRHDPFDRLLVAQASQAGMRLLTADRVLLDLDRGFIVDATA